MAMIITNRATLDYRFGAATASTASNTTTAVLGSGVNIEKTALSEKYRKGQSVTYILAIENNGAATDNIAITDDLGTYSLNGTEYTPMTYIGSAQLFINGVFESIVTPTVGTGFISFNVPRIPAGGNAQIIYQARINEFADVGTGGHITNTVTADCNCPCDVPATAANTIYAEDFADVRILKSVCPNPIVCGENLTYVFDIYNYGNTEATDVVLTDTFEPALRNITVILNGSTLPSEYYSYINGTLILPNPDSEHTITVHGATINQNPQTGVFDITPGHIQIMVTGEI